MTAPSSSGSAGHQVEQERAGDAQQFGRLGWGEPGLSQAAALVAGYLGADPPPLPRPLAIDAASVR
jgi:hypothetical protein